MSERVFKNPTEVFEEQLNDIFVKSKNENNNTVLQILSLLTYENTKNRDLTDLYNLVGVDEFVSIISLFEGRTITFPTKEEVKENLLLALVYYYREIENMSWPEIKEKIPFEFSTISYSMKIKSLNEKLKKRMNEMLQGEI